MLAALLDILEAHVELHTVLLETAKDKQHAIIKGDLEQMRELVKTESQWVKKISETEGARQTLLKNDITLHEYLETCPDGEEKQQVLQLALALQTKITELQRQNELNRLLTEDALAFNQQSIELIAGVEDQPNYEPPQQGQKNQSSGNRRLFDSQA